MGLNVSFSMAIHFQNAHKMLDFQYPLIAENGMMYHKERHPLLMKCFKPILRCMSPMGGALDSICLSIIGPTEPFSTKVGSQIARKMSHCLRIPSQCRKYITGCWTARRDIHCLWSVWKPSLDRLHRYEELPWASLQHMWVSPAMFYKGWLSNY